MKHMVGMLVIGALVLLGAACSGPTLDEARVQFCEDLSVYAEAVVALGSLDETATVDQLNEAQARVEDAWNDLQGSAEVLGETRRNALRVANDEFVATINDIPGESTLGDARVVVQQATLQTVDAYDDILRTTCAYGQE